MDIQFPLPVIFCTNKPCSRASHCLGGHCLGCMVIQAISSPQVSLKPHNCNNKGTVQYRPNHLRCMYISFALALLANTSSKICISPGHTLQCCMHTCDGVFQRCYHASKLHAMCCDRMFNKGPATHCDEMGHFPAI